MATQKKRYYVHGDQYEPDGSLYYCAECDVFFDQEHFSKQHREDHYSRYLDAKKYIDKLMKSSKEYFRPEHPENMFS